MDKVYVVDVYGENKHHISNLSYAFTVESEAWAYYNSMCNSNISKCILKWYAVRDKAQGIELSDYVMKMDVRGDIKSCSKINTPSHNEYIRQSDDPDISLIVCTFAVDEAAARLRAEELRKEYIKDRFNLWRRNDYEETY